MATIEIIKKYKNCKKVKEGELWGIQSKDDEPIIPMIYDYVGDLQDGGYVTIKKDNLWGCVRINGKNAEEICQPQFLYISSFKDDVARVTLKCGKKSFINKAGQLMFEKGFDEIVNILPKGYAIVKDDDLFGIVNLKTVEQTLPCCYETITTCGDNIRVSQQVVLA